MPPPKKQRDSPFVAELCDAINKLPKTLDMSPLGERAWENIDAHKVTVMGPYDQGTVMESLVSLVKDIWMIKNKVHHKYGWNKDFALMVSIFVRTFEETWRHWAAARYRPLGLAGTHGAFYVEVIEPAIKARTTFAISKQVYGLYVRFHALLMHIDSQGRDDLMPGRITTFGVGGFGGETLDRQMQVLKSVPGTVTRESLKAAYLDKPAVSARYVSLRDHHGIDDMSAEEWKAYWDRHDELEAMHKLETHMEAIEVKATPVLPVTDQGPGGDEDKDLDEEEIPMTPYDGEVSESDEIVDDDAMQT